MFKLYWEIAKLLSPANAGVFYYQFLFFVLICLDQKEYKMKISFDLDNTIFDMEPIYKRANEEFGVPYKIPTHWDVDKCYPPNVTARLLELFADDSLYTMPLISAEYPVILNNVLNNNNYETFFVTQRMLQQPQKSFAQLRNAGINCRYDQVHDNPTPKVDILQKIGVDVHFDDSPYVVDDCLRAGVNVVMISNDKTPYNHYLRRRVKYYGDLKTALVQTKIYG